MNRDEQVGDISETRRIGDSTAFVIATSLWAVTLGTLPSITAGTLAPFIVAETAVSRSAVGVLYASFHLAGAFFTIISGRLADTFGVRRVLVTMPLISAVALVIIGFSDGLLTMSLGMFLCGVAFSVSNPGTNKLMADRIPAGPRLGLAIGIKQGGIPLAAVIAGSAFIAGAEAFGWRASFVGGILIGCLIMLLLALRIRVDQTTNRPAAGDSSDGNRAPLITLAVVGFGMGTGMSIVMAYFVLYLVESDAALSPVAAGWIFAFAGGVGIIGRIGWSVATRPGLQWKNLIATSIGALIAGLSMALGMPLNPWMLVVLPIMIGIFILGWSGIFQVAMIYESGSRVGRGSGIGFTGYGFGLMSGPSLFGAVLGLTDSYELAWSVACVGFVIAIVAATYGARVLYPRYHAPA